MNNFPAIILKKPRLSEKSTGLRAFNQYVFDVENKANKNEAKKAIENYYKVKVIKIRIINTPSKTKRWMRKISHFQRSKKAIITLKEGQKIELGV